MSTPPPTAAPAPPAPPADGERQHKTRSRARPGGIAIEKVEGLPFRGQRKPSWLKVPAPGGTKYRELKKQIEGEGLHTVCAEANCPNIGECWERGTATFMILGDTCTRRCGFCNVKTGKPTWNDPLEPARVARSVARMGLRHAVITSVDRDDLPDYGASVWCGVIRSIRRQAPACKVEVLTPDFLGVEEAALATVLGARPQVFNHNIETVRRLHRRMRGAKADYDKALWLLARAKEVADYDVLTKSGIIVGLGEEGKLRAADLAQSVRQAVIAWAQRLAENRKHGPQFFALATALIGSGGTGVTAGEAARLIAQGVSEANAVLKEPVVWWEPAPNTSATRSPQRPDSPLQRNKRFAPPVVLIANLLASNPGSSGMLLFDDDIHSNGTIIEAAPGYRPIKHLVNGQRAAPCLRNAYLKIHAYQ